MAKPFEKLSARRSAGSPAKCLCAVDSGRSATGFPNPAKSVTRVGGLDFISANQTYLEVGGGNLRNALFVQREFAPRRMVVVEQRCVVNRFASAYQHFQHAGGTVQDEVPRGRFDVIIATYVFETICPPRDRNRLLARIANAMGPNSRLILSVRGYPGVRGRYYKRCPHSDGSITPRGAFVRGYSIPELEAFLRRHGLEFEALQKYRCETPENIHGIAKLAAC